MPRLASLCWMLPALATATSAASLPSTRESSPLYKRQSSSLTVDLGYEVYEGFTNTTTNINNWLGYIDLHSEVVSF